MLLLKNGQILNEEGEKVATDILILDGKIAQIAPNIDAGSHQIIELDEKLITPGLIDVHVHLREPGGEHKETVATGTAAAARGGYTLIAAMPNTIPTPDSRENLNVVLEKIKKDAIIRVLPYGSITTALKGDELINFADIAADVIAFTDDGRGIQEAGMMYEAMKNAKNVDKPIVAHCEDDSLLFGGYLHEGTYSDHHNHKGILSASESIHVARDAILASATGVKYHVCHVSTKESVSIIRWAKSEGINITAEVSPHHLLLADKDILETDLANYKMNPPLRDETDRLALIAGVVDGTIDIIATDHAPHACSEKALPINEAPFGIVGLETAFSLMYTHFVKNGDWSLKFLIDRMTKIPAEIFGLPYGNLSIGAKADIAIFDLGVEYEIDTQDFVSKGKNTPFDGHKVAGATFMTIVDGEIVYQRN